MNKNYDQMTKLECQTEIDKYEDGYYSFKDTVFYGEKGGQPDDKGFINGLELKELKWDGDILLHKIDGQVQNPIIMKVEEKTRFLNASVQTTFHILDGFFRKKDLYMPEVNSDPDNLWFEVNEKNISREILNEAEEFVNKVIRDNIKLEFSYIKGEDYPDEFYQKFDELRLVKIDGVDEQPCGTCHVESTGQIGSFAILNTENTKRGTKVHVAIGQNMIEQIKKQNRSLIELGKILSTGTDGLVEKVKELLNSNNEAKNYIKTLEEFLISYKVKELEKEEEQILFLEDEASSNIRNLGQELLNIKSKKKAILTVEANEVFFAMISLEDKAQDYLKNLRDKSIIVKGGGPKSIVSGKFDKVEDIDLLELFREVTED